MGHRWGLLGPSKGHLKPSLGHLGPKSFLETCVQIGPHSGLELLVHLRAGFGTQNGNMFRTCLNRLDFENVCVGTYLFTVMFEISSYEAKIKPEISSYKV